VTVDEHRCLPSLLTCSAPDEESLGIMSRSPSKKLKNKITGTWPMSI
jgi:hypothetical protein